MKKQLLILMTSFMSLMAYSQVFTVDHITYLVTSTTSNTVKAFSYDTAGGTNVIIPDTVDDNSITYSVTAIHQMAFMNKNLTSVALPSSLISIEMFAFATNQISSIIIPDSVMSIAIAAFENNQLISVNIPASLTVIEDQVFRNNQLNNMFIPDGITSIGQSAFYNNLFTTVIIPNSVTNISSYAFSSNPLISVISEAVLAPTIVTGGAGDSFGTSRSTIDLTIPTGTSAAYVSAQWTGFNSVTEVGSAQIGDTFIDNFITYGVTSLTPNAVQTIDYDMTGGTVVDIPAMVTYNGISYSVTQIGIDSFFNNQLTSVTIPDSVQYIINFAFGTNQLQTVTIPDGVISIGGNAFVNNQISSLTISNTVTAIGLAAFATNQLTSVTIPEGVNSLAASVFNNNPLNSVTSESLTPPMITTGSGDSFNVDRSGIDLFIPSGTSGVYVTDPGALWTGFNSVTEVGSAQVGNTFTVDFTTYEVTSLTPNTVEAIDYDMAGGTVVDLPATVSYTGINYSVTSIGQAAFALNQLTSITIPNSVISIGQAAFQQNQLSSITIPDSVINLGLYAFAINQLTNVTIGSGITNIPEQAFSSNLLSDIIIPINVTSIGWRSFDVNPLNNVTTINPVPPTIITGTGDTFSSDRSTIHLHIPAGTMGAYVTDAGALWTGFNPVTEDALSIQDFDFANNVKVITTSNEIRIIASNAIHLENYSIFNISGAKVATGTESEISSSFLSDGIYILKLKFNKGVYVKKIIVN
jgi:hypothetical protein